jgi:hypothetical protein
MTKRTKHTTSRTDKFNWGNLDDFIVYERPKYPEITVNLVGQDSNAFMILGLCNRAMKQAGLSAEERDAFRTEAMSGLLATAMKWFNVE